MATVLTVDRNGSKHYEGYVDCDRCGGDGIYKWGYMRMSDSGEVIPQFRGTCFKCEGRGKLLRKWIERTPEYQAKLDARRAARHPDTARFLIQDEPDRDALNEKARADAKAWQERVNAALLAEA